MEKLHIIVLAILMIAIALALVRLRSLLAIAILTGVYSLILAVVFTLLDAVDVAFTEAAVGAGITLTLMLAAISLTTRSETKPGRRTTQRVVGGLTAAIAGAGLLYATTDMPNMGAFDAPIHQHVAPYYIEEGPRDTGVPNMVTAILASYRGFDTLGEVTVIFTAGISVMALLWRWGRDRT
jgi:multicomponent Na+:H+ antiporter subunit B